MEETQRTGDIAPALSARLTPADDGYHELVQRLFLKSESLTQDKRQLESQHQLKSHLIANISHELRGPAASIVSYGSLLAEGTMGPLTALQRESLQQITASGHALLQTLSDLTVWSQLASNELQIFQRSVSLSDIANEVLKTMQAQFEAKQHSVTVQLELPLPDVHVDPERIHQILFNLLDNACKFTPTGGNLGLSIRKEGTRIVLEVSDDGLGIAPEHQASIFDAAYQIHDQRTKLTGGTGLGLSIVKQLTELHGGTLELESAPGNGSCFSVSLPL